MKKKNYLYIITLLTLSTSPFLFGEKGPSFKAKIKGNRIELPRHVQQHLGISFAKAKYKNISKTLTLPGYFELLPSAEQHYPMPTEGRVHLYVQVLEKVKKNQLLLELDSPIWRKLQYSMIEAKAQLLQAEAQLKEAQSLKIAVGKLNTQSTKEQPSLYDAKITAAEAHILSSREKLHQLVSHASTLTGLTVQKLSEKSKDQYYWQKLQSIPVYAVDEGVVREIKTVTGSWVTAKSDLIHIVNPKILRFHAKALQSDLYDKLEDGLKATLFQPDGIHRGSYQESLHGILHFGVTGDIEKRTLDVFVEIKNKTLPKWVRPQINAIAEVQLSKGSLQKELVIPRRALIQDGLQYVFFRRDPKDPNVVIRTVADLGPINDRWASLYSGIALGHEVVMEGVYQLKLATSNTQQQSGHYHADGTFHGEDH